MELTVRFIPRYSDTSVKREVTQNLSSSVVLADVELVSVMVEFMVELETNGSVLIVSFCPTWTRGHSRLETNEFSDQGVHADDILNVGTGNIILCEIIIASRAKVLCGRI